MDGYQVVNFKNVVIDDEDGATIEGLYESIDGAIQATLVEGLNDDGTEYNPFYTVFVKGEDKYTGVITGYSKQVEITNEDAVSITAVE